MNLGLAARLALIFAALVAFTALITSGAGAFSTNSQVRQDIDRFLRDRAEEITDGTRPDPRDRRDGRGENGRSRNAGGQAVVNAVADGLADADTEVQLLLITGEVETLGVALPIELADQALVTERGPALLRTVDVEGVDYRMITQHVEGLGAVQIARDLGDTNNLLASIRTRALLIGLVMSAMAALIGWLLARRATEPLRALTASVENVAATQDLTTSVGLDRSDEIGRLAAGFDRMLKALATSRDQQHRLVQDAAHELRTPLTSIRANVELLTRAPDLDDETRRATLAGIRSELGQLNGLFTEIIELATDARDTPAHVPIDLADVTAAAIEGFRARSSKAVTLERADSPVVGDRTALERAVTNLLSNADKYSPPASTISVVVGGGTVTVRDSGPGVPSDEIDLVFERFYRSDQARALPGSGLGLAIVAKTVEDHGGRPFITNPAGGGTAAGFTLPTASGDGRS